MITIKKYIDVPSFLQQKAINGMDVAISECYIKATTPGMVPIDTGLTKNTTTKSVSHSVNKLTGQVSINTPYAKYPYNGTENMPPGGVTGTPKWLEVSCKNVTHIILKNLRI